MGATHTYGWPYPEYGWIGDGADVVQDLAVAMDATVATLRSAIDVVEGNSRDMWARQSNRVGPPLSLAAGAGTVIMPNTTEAATLPGAPQRAGWYLCSQSLVLIPVGARGSVREMSYTRDGQSGVDSGSINVTAGSFNTRMVNQVTLIYLTATQALAMTAVHLNPSNMVTSDAPSERPRQSLTFITGPGPTI